MYKIIADRKSHGRIITLAETSKGYRVSHTASYSFDGIVDLIECAEEFIEDRMYSAGSLCTHNFPIKMSSNDPYENALAYFNSL